MRLTHCLAFASIIGVGAPACGGSDLVLPNEGVAARIDVVSGDGQTAIVSAALPANLVVRIVDSRNRPVEGQQVEFAAAAGSGLLTPASASTDADGRASSQWVLGPATGGQTATARPVGNGAPASLTASFSATATASQAARVVKQAGDNQTATAGTAVAVPPTVRVFDINDNPVAGVPVTFAVATGGGSVAPVTPVSTNADGIAAPSSWTLGPVAGPNSLTATVGGASVSGSPLTFQATGVVGSANRLVFSVQPVNVAVGAAIDPPVEVQIQDANGNPVTTANGQVTITLGNNPAGASLSGQTTVSAQQGTARFTNLRLSAPGTRYTLRALASGLADATSTPFDVVNGGSRTRITDITPSSTVVGQPYRVDFSVTAAAPASGTPTGLVTVSDGAGASCQASAAAGSCSLTSTTKGTKQIVATYSGDANFGGSASDPENHAVNAAQTTTAITADTPDPSVLGQDVTVRFTVSVDPPGSGTPDGTVTVTYAEGGTCSAPVSQGQCTLRPLGGGNDRNLTAKYTSISGNFASSEDTEDHTVVRGTTTTGLTASPNPSNAGQAVLLTATVTVTQGIGVPSGQVRFRDGGSQIGQVSLVGGTATLSHAFGLPVTHSLTAEYLGDATFDGSTSAAVQQNVNGPPVSDNDSYATTEDNALVVDAANGVLDGDSDPNGDALTAVLQSGPSHGTLTLATNGSFTYTPAANYSGPDGFTYRASDGLLSSSVATVTIAVGAVNDAPVGAADGYVSSGLALQVDAPGVLENDSDPEGSPLTAELVTLPGHAIVFSLSENGSFSYTPDLGFTGSDSFTYRVSDGSLQSDPVTVTITVGGP
jgi:VCBS repeat-containing protein